MKKNSFIIIVSFILFTLLLQLKPLFSANTLTIYDDTLSSGWDNWSWNTTLNFSVTNPVKTGTKSISVKYNSAWAGLYLHYNSQIALQDYSHIKFWIHGGTAGSQSIKVVINGSEVPLRAMANTWQEISIPLTSFGSPGNLSDIFWQDNTGNAQPMFYLDDIILYGETGTPPPPSGTVSININAGNIKHKISEDIYGINFASDSLRNELKVPVNRWGGNSVTRYNWEIDVHNTGSDWYFENIPDASLNPQLLPDGSTADQFVEGNIQTNTKNLMTIPMIGWLPKTRLSNHPYDCGFKVSKYGSQQSVDPWDTDCGNGVYTNGNNITGNDPSDTSKAVNENFISQWLSHLVTKYGSASQGGVRYYNLDNEPMLWNHTHRDVHPQPAGYDEIKNKTIAYAAALKTVDPAAMTLGPVLWGWCAYFYSAIDGCQIGSDYTSHGNKPFVEWYLQQMKLYEDTYSKRILDYLDLHYYPQASGVALSGAGNSATQELRLRSVKSLWDATYTDESWINTIVRLIPRMKQWTNNFYPGTKTAITEYNWGALDHINGALTQAEVLGVFGREALDLATLWAPPDTGEPGFYAFKIYRNYDNNGNGFGDMSIEAVSSDYDKVSVYSAIREKDGALSIMAINKTSSSMDGNFNISGINLNNTVEVYRYSASNLNAIIKENNHTANQGKFTAVLPANSISLFIINKNSEITAIKILACDLNGDSLDDIIKINENNSAQYTLNLSGWNHLADNVSDIACGDIVGDNKNELVVLSDTGEIYYTTDNGYSWTKMQGNLDKIYVSNMNGDSKADIMGLNKSGNIYITYNLQNWENIPGTLSDIKAGNFNTTRGGNEIAGINFLGSIFYNSDNLTGWHNVPGILDKLFAADLDKNSKCDILGINNLKEIYYSTDLISWTKIPGLLQYIETGDFDGDLDKDIIGYNASNLIYYTTNLQTWIQIPGMAKYIISGKFNINNIEDIAVIGMDGKIYYSTNLSDFIKIN